jgi:cobalt transporter subunit CbtA
MIHKVLGVGLLAGLVTGLAIAVLAHFTTVPLIAAGEVYEQAATHAGMSMPVADGHVHDEDGWSPSDGLERTFYTSVAAIATWTGLGLVLLALQLLAGEAITPRTSLAWALGGYAAVHLATSLGLPPELPGFAAADLAARQSWWIGTAVCTAASLFLAFKVNRAPALPFGLLLIAAPQVIGAPREAAYASTAPAELAARFAATSLTLSAVGWCLAGLTVGWVWQRWSATEEAA